MSLSYSFLRSHNNLSCLLSVFLLVFLFFVPPFTTSRRYVFFSPLSSFTHLSFLCHVCILLAYLSGLFCPSDCLILIIFYLSFGQERPNVGTWPKCILFLSLPPRWRVCLFLSYPLFWPSPVSVCSSNRTKDHAIAESDRSDRQIQN